MKTLLVATVLISLGIVPGAQGQDITRQELITASGARYRVSGVNGSFMALPEGGQPSMPTMDESLALCDELVAAILEWATPAGRKPPHVLDRTVPLLHGRTWVDYSQRHQGYRVLGYGARIELDAAGRISSAGVQYESEAFPRFKPRNVASLEKVARWAVGRAITGPALMAEIMVDPNGDAPARLIYYAIFPVLEFGREAGWQVAVDAITGKVISSGSTTKHVAARP